MNQLLERRYTYQVEDIYFTILLRSLRFHVEYLVHYQHGDCEAGIPTTIAKSIHPLYHKLVLATESPFNPPSLSNQRFTFTSSSSHSSEVVHGRQKSCTQSMHFASRDASSLVSALLLVVDDSLLPLFAISLLLSRIQNLLLV